MPWKSRSCVQQISCVHIRGRAPELGRIPVVSLILDGCDVHQGEHFAKVLHSSVGTLTFDPEACRGGGFGFA